MNQNKILGYSLILMLIVTSFSRIGFAQTTGKIAGRVFDKDTREPLPGANIVIEGTDQGAAADHDGKFFIINIPPGVYNLKASMMGYAGLTIQDVRVRVNSTTDLSFELRLEAVAGEEVIVTAEAITIKKDQTSSVRTVSTEELELLPVENLAQVVNLQAGVVNGHFRGGRNTEVTYLIDGINIDNVFNRNSINTQVDIEVINELEVITGTFNAEYGKAMSGVVNAITKEGAAKFSGSFSSRFANYLTGNNDVFIGLGQGDFLTRNLSRDYKLQLEGPIINEKLSFLINYRHQNNNGYLNGIRHFNPRDYNAYIGLPEEWHTESTGDREFVSMETFKYDNFFGKLTFKASSNLKISALGTYNDNTSTGYSHAWKYNPDPRSTYIGRSLLGALMLNHVISASLFYDLKLSYNQEKQQSYMYENPLDERYISPHYQGLGQTGFITGGMPGPGKSTDTFSNGNLKFDLYWQINHNHGFKTGFQGTLYEIDRDRIDVRNIYEGSADELAQVVDPLTGKIDFPNYELQIVPKTKETLDVYTVNPQEFSAYFQDKMEFDELVLNLGLRYDYFNPRQVYPSDRRNPGNQLILPDSMMSAYPNAPSKSQLSPRFGLAYQLSDVAVLRFSYGHFFQIPPMFAMYKNNVFRVPTNDFGITMGNTLLEPEKTVSYEIGLWQKLAEGMSLELALYYKDIYDLLSTQIIATYNQIEYGLYTNKDYGNARGLEVKWRYQTGGFLANLNYTLAYTKGNADEPEQTFNRAGGNMDPIRRYIPMSWDQRHTLNLTAGYSWKSIGFNTTLYYNSGRPYTFTPLGYSPLSLINLYTNNDYQPGSFNVDLTSYWRLPIFGDYDVYLTLDVYNFLDALNARWVYGDTGKPYTTIVTDAEIDNYKSNFTDVYDQYQNPEMYSPPRQVKLGLSFKF